MNAVRVGQLKVTLAPAAELREQARGLEAEAATLTASADRLLVAAGERLVEAGTTLVTREQEWLERRPAARRQVAAVRRSQTRVDELAATPGEARPRFAVFARRRQDPLGAAAEREARELDLRAALTRLARAHGEALDGPRETRQQAVVMEKQASEAVATARRLQKSARALSAEAEHRERSVRDLGLDAPFEAATLQRSTPQLQKSPLQLRAGERLYLVEPATLARERAFASAAGEAEQEALPLQVTGIAFRVGTRRARVLPRETISMLGAGVFVVTDQRLGFVGDLKSFSFPLTDLLRVDHYDDGLVLLREGRDNLDVVISPGAGRILFYINWVLVRQPGSA